MDGINMAKTAKVVEIEGIVGLQGTVSGVTPRIVDEPMAHTGERVNWEKKVRDSWFITYQNAGNKNIDQINEIFMGLDPT
mmetsp:Transcript_5643/g.10575  ORF Transcript_5643/g.10575 Transcript_5643/m.10575 type:complete len:80 (+) Transcript_5643:276-515(+)